MTDARGGPPLRPEDLDDDAPKEYVRPGDDPLLDAAMAHMGKQLKPGEAPFHFQLGQELRHPTIPGMARGENDRAQYVQQVPVPPAHDPTLEKRRIVVVEDDEVTREREERARPTMRKVRAAPAMGPTPGVLSLLASAPAAANEAVAREAASADARALEGPTERDLPRIDLPEGAGTALSQDAGMALAQDPAMARDGAGTASPEVAEIAPPADGRVSYEIEKSPWGGVKEPAPIARELLASSHAPREESDVTPSSGDALPSVKAHEPRRSRAVWVTALLAASAVGVIVYLNFVGGERDGAPVVVPAPTETGAPVEAAAPGEAAPAAVPRASAEEAIEAVAPATSVEPATTAPPEATVAPAVTAPRAPAPSHVPAPTPAASPTSPKPAPAPAAPPATAKPAATAPAASPTASAGSGKVLPFSAPKF